MATVSETPRTNRITLASPSAGPFAVGFRLFSADGLEVYVDGAESTDFTLTADLSGGYDDAATITFGSTLASSTVIQIDGAEVPGRAADYLNPDPGLTGKMNLELARIAAALSEVVMKVARTIRALDAVAPDDGVTAVDLSNLATYAAEAEEARDTVVAIEATLPNWTGAWVTATAYEFGDLARYEGSTYFCIVNHTSGTFTTDLAASKWEMFAQKGTAGAGNGDVEAANNGSEFTEALFKANLNMEAGVDYQAFNQLLSAVAGLSSNGMIARLSGSTAAARTIAGTANQITVTNGDGVSGNPTIAAVVASQAEAEAGTDTTKLMTAERVAQAIAALASTGLESVETLNTTSGTVWTMTAAFEAGYDYMFRFNAVSHNSASARAMTVSFYGATDAAWSPYVAMTGAGTSSDYWYGEAFYQEPAATKKLHAINGEIALDADAGGSNHTIEIAGASGAARWYATAQAVTRCRFAFSSSQTGNNGNIEILRRRS